MAQAVSFRLPVVRALPVQVQPEVVFHDDDLQVTLPKRLRLVRPGDTIPIKVDLAEEVSRPDSIYIITPFYFFQDQDSTGQYEVKIPKEQQDGPLTVIILANWRQEGEEQTLSKSFTVQVKHPQKPCPDDRPSANRKVAKGI